MKKILFISIIISLYFQLLGTNKGLFIENKNQWSSDIAYKNDIGNGRQIYFYKDKLTFVSYHYDYKTHKRRDLNPHAQPNRHPHTKRIKGVKGHIFDIKFLNSNIETTFQPSIKQNFYHNYFLGDKNSWASEVPLYKYLVYKNIYPEINLALKGIPNGLKYEFQVSAHADPQKIRLAYEGLLNIYLENNKLYMITSLDTLIESSPYCYQVIDNDTIFVPSLYKLENKILTYDFPNGYNTNYDLIIDPQIAFATLSGSTNDNWGSIATPGENGSVYGIGKIFGNSFIPINTGSFDMTFNGGDMDISILKFNSTGILLYAAFLGGDDTDNAHSARIDNNNDLVILGTTGSNNFPTSATAFDNTFNGGTMDFISTGDVYLNGSDIFITKISANGTNILGSTLLGSNASDGLNTLQDYFFGASFDYAYEEFDNLIFDASNNIYIATTTNGDITAPNKVGSLQGAQDGIVAKFNSDLSQVLWLSYIGSTGLETATDIAINSSGLVAIIGTTTSSNFPTTAGTLNQTYQGNGDAFVVTLNGTTGATISSTFLGTANREVGFSLDFDRNDNIVATGWTAGQYPLTNGVYTFGGGNSFLVSDIFFHKINSTLTQTLFSTRINGSILNLMGFGLDNCDQLNLIAWANTFAGFTNELNLPITDNAVQPVSQDSADLYYLILSSQADALVYATFYGGNDNTRSGDHSDGGRTNIGKNGNIVIPVCSCSDINNSFPTTAGAFASSVGSLNCNQGLVRFNVEDLISSGDVSFTTSFLPNQCAPVTVNFTNTSTRTTNFQWDVGDGSSLINSQDLTYTYTQAGTYIIRLIGGSASCGINIAIDTIIVPSSAIQRQENHTICVGDTVQLNISGGISYNWTPTIGLSAFNIPNPQAFPTQTTTYLVDIDNGMCLTTDTVTIQVIQNLIVDFSATVINRCDSLQTALIINNTSVVPSIDIDYFWTTEDGQILTGDISEINFNQIGSSVIHLEAGKDRCLESDSIRLDIGLNPQFLSSNQVNVIPKDTLLCSSDESVQLQAIGGESYIWSPASGLSNPNSPNPIASPLNTTTYKVQVINEFGCLVEDSLIVNIAPQINFNIQTTVFRDRCSQKPFIEFKNTTIGASHYLWDFGDGITSTEQEVSYQYAEKGTYTVRLSAFSSANNCSEDTSFEVTSEQETPYNAFSPNNDGLNDFFDLGIQQTGWKLKVYNRWGTLIYESDDYKNDWSGENYPAATYYYELISPEKVKCRGWVAILK